MSTIKLEINSEDVIALRATGEVFTKIANNLEGANITLPEVPSDNLDAIRELLTDPELTINGEFLEIIYFVNGRKAGAQYKLADIVNNFALCLRSIRLGVIELEQLDAEEQVEASTPVPPTVEVNDFLAECETFRDDQVSLPSVLEQSTTVGVDVKGLPWDARIHAGSKATVKDGSWKMRKKPADKTPEEWTALIEEVEGELKELMAIPVPPSEGPFYWVHDESEARGMHATREAMDQYINSGEGLAYEVDKEVYDAKGVEWAEPNKPSLFDEPTPPVVLPRPPVVNDPKPLPVPPVLAGSTPAAVEAVDFKTLMTFVTKQLTGRFPEVTKALNDVGIPGTSPLAQLAKRPDLIGLAYTTLQGLLNA